MTKSSGAKCRLLMHYDCLSNYFTLVQSNKRVLNVPTYRNTWNLFKQYRLFRIERNVSTWIELSISPPPLSLSISVVRVSIIHTTRIIYIMQRHIRDIRTTELLKRRIKIIALYMVIFGDEKKTPLRYFLLLIYFCPFKINFNRIRYLVPLNFLIR